MPARDPDFSEDLLAQREEEEFEASVRAARERAIRNNAALKAPSTTVESEDDTEIIWSEQEDVFCPTPADLPELLTLLGVPPPRSAGKPTSLVAIRKEALDTLCAHVETDTSVELGGLLAGQVFFDAARTAFVILVETALPALEGERTPTSFTYTPGSWSSIQPRMSELHPGWTLVGSYHSHPGLGVFLSATDRATQSDAFPHDWQIAMVVDPITRSIGYFIGVDGVACPHTVLR